MADQPPPSWAIVADYATRLDQAEKAAAAEHRMWCLFLALLPYAVPVPKSTVRIPEQRRPSGREVDLWPRSLTQQPQAPETRPASRFIDSRARGHL